MHVAAHRALAAAADGVLAAQTAAAAVLEGCAAVVKLAAAAAAAGADGAESGVGENGAVQILRVSAGDEAQEGKWNR
eukprot:1157312-Pelagomonas_calceolata.AAC.3